MFQRMVGLKSAAVFAPVDEMPTFETQPSYDVALEKFQHNSTGFTGEPVTVAYIADHPEGARWTALVTSPGFADVQGVMEWDP